MTYEKTNWKNDTEPFLEAENLNNIEEGIFQAHQMIANYTVDWFSINNKPTQYPPSFHGHAWSDISGKPTTFDPVIGDTATSAKAGDWLPTWGDVQSKPISFSPSAHTHDWVDIYNIPFDYTIFATKSELNQKASTAQVEDMINNIQPVDLSTYATKSYVTNAINEAVLAGGDVEIDLTSYALKTDVDNKVDKINGKGLSTNDFTNVEKQKLEYLENFDPTPLQASINNKVEKITGKGLSESDYTTTEKSKLAGIEVGAQKNPDMSIYALKTDLKSATQMEFNGEALEGLRRYVYDTTASDGSWEIDYADKGFTKFVNVYFYSIAKGTALADRTIPTLKQGQPTLTRCEGYLMSASSAGLLAAMTLVNGSGPVRIIVEGV